MRSYGYKPSNIIGTELNAANYIRNVEIPNKYEISSLGPISDQGSKPICVSVCLNTILRWKLKFRNIDSKLDDSIFYDLDEDSNKDGMQPKKGFQILANGTGILPSGYTIYAMVKSVEVAKRAIIQNGPLLVALKVQGDTNIFWKGGQNLGGHAVIFSGFNQNGFILRNSWGASYGYGGYFDFPYDDFYLVKEAWTLIS